MSQRNRSEVHLSAKILAKIRPDLKDGTSVKIVQSGLNLLRPNTLVLSSEAAEGLVKQL